jgi:hypothetical protein
MSSAIVLPAAQPARLLSTRALTRWIATIGLVIVMAVSSAGVLDTIRSPVAIGTPADAARPEPAPGPPDVVPLIPGESSPSTQLPPWATHGATAPVSAPAARDEEAQDRVQRGPLWQRLETAYRFDIHLSVRTGVADVVETLDLRNPTGEPLTHVDLSIQAAATGEFRLASITRDGRAASPRWTNSANIEIALDPPIRDASAEFVVTYRLQPSGDTRSSLATRTSIADGIVRFGGWFPVVSDGHGFRQPGDSQVTADARAFRLHLTLDRPAVVAAPGDPLVSSKRDTVFVLRDARDFAFAVSDRFVVGRRQSSGISIESYTLRGAPAAAAVASADRALTAFRAAYGSYPYTRFLLVQSPRSKLGNEYPGMAFLGVDSLADPVVVAHETAHQWFYGIVGSDQIREPWLDEALAEFAATDLYGKAQEPCDPGPIASPASAFPARRDTLECGGYGDTVYRGGAALVATVRNRLGGERFDQAMRRYVEGSAGAIATTDDLVGAWLAAAGDPASLQAVIDAALYGDAQGSVTRDGQS